MKAKEAIKKADEFMDDIKASLKKEIAEAKQKCVDELNYTTNKCNEKRKAKKEAGDKLKEEQNK